MEAGNLALMQKNGLIAKKHNLAPEHMELLGRLTEDEIKTLIRVKRKLGVRFLSRGLKGGKFPHPDSSSF